MPYVTVQHKVHAIALIDSFSIEPNSQFGIEICKPPSKVDGLILARITLKVSRAFF